MASSNMAFNGMAVTPHHLATQSAHSILKEGGTAMEAVVAAAATIAVVYPHMNSIGGDGFWLIVPPHEDPFVIEASGAAGSLATLDFFADHNNMPRRGPKAAITVPGTVGGWQEALNYVTECGYIKKSLTLLLADAIKYAEEGYPVTTSYVQDLKKFMNEGDVSEDFKRIYLPNGIIPEVGERFYQKKLSATFKRLAADGLSSFYQGKLAKSIVADITALGMPITEADLMNYSSVRKTPLRLQHSQGELFNTPPPSQGLVSLSILGILDKLTINGKDDGEFIHLTVEATKQAFEVRDQFITDPCFMNTDPEMLLNDNSITKLANNINNKVSGVGKGKDLGDTIWIGVMDSRGFSVSFIQSVYHSFGSGVILPNTGILWHNRGVAFTLEKNDILSLKPGKKPFHTLNPAAARLNDGRILVYGTRGGDGQSQTQAAIFHRYVIQGMELQESVSAPRWIYGRATAENHDNILKLEDRFPREILEYLKDSGHDVEMLPKYSSMVGHAGILVRHPNGLLEGAFDPRSNGSAVGF